MSGRLPQTVQPGRLADAGETLRGSQALDTLSRLAPCLNDTEGVVDVELDFGVDAGRVRTISGHLHATLHLVCQRCLAPMDWPLDVELQLGIVGSEDAAEQLPEQYDPLVIEDGQLDIRALIEDELLLALPIVALHPVGACGIDLPVEAVAEAPPRQETRQPFADLAAMLKAKAEERG